MLPPPATPEPSNVEGALAQVEKEFVDLWRNMSSLWGISPTMAQIHGLLFITGETLSMDDLMVRLGISRGNASMNLARLLEWNLVRKVHRRGDRREYFEALGDVWEMFTHVAAQRKRREIDPMLQTLRQTRERLVQAAQETSGDNPLVVERSRRVDDLLAFLGLMDALAQRFFESNRSLRAAMEGLARKSEDRTATD
ncbi:MAG: MarR family transcriptional regulator [Gemmataceae bacterium]